jgi:hypothetical protein
VTHDGRLVLDLSNGNLRGANEPVEELVHHLTLEDPQTGRPITKWVVRQPSAGEQRDDLLMLYDEIDEERCVRRTTVHTRLHWYTRNELELMLERTGWRVADLYGDYDLSPYGDSSTRLLVVAAPA